MQANTPSRIRTAAPRASHRLTALRILAAGAIGLLLYVGHVAFVPVALALLLALVLSGPVESLHSMRVPRSASALLILLLILGSAAGIADLLLEPAEHWFADAPHTVRVIGKKIRPLAQFMGRVDDLSNSAGNLASGAHPAAAPAATATVSAPAMLIDFTRGVALGTATVFILTFFLLAGGPPMLARMSAALASDLESAHVRSMIDKVRREVGRFYVTTALINIGLGVATGCAMMLCGMPNPLLWGTVAGVLNFIPYAGPTATLILLTGVAVVSFDSFAHIAAVSGSFLALALVEGQMVQPLLVGRRLQLNPMLVFLALWFGGFFWGIAGVVLATPALVALKVIAEHSVRGRPVVEFLSPETAAARAAVDLPETSDLPDAIELPDASDPSAARV